MKKRNAVYVCLIVLFAVSVSYQTRYSMDFIREALHPTERVRVPFGRESVTAVITWVRPEAAKAGVRRGDRLISVNGRLFTGEAALAEALERARPGDSLNVGLRRTSAEGSPSEETVTLQLEPRTTEPTPVRDWVVGSVLFVATPLVCLALGFWVAALRPHDPLAWLLLGLMLSFTQLVPADLYSWPAGLRETAIIYHTFFATSWAIWMLLFGVYFPERLTYERRWPWIKWALVVPLLVYAVIVTIVAVGRVAHLAAVAPLERLLQPYQMGQVMLSMLAIGTFFFNLGMKQGTASSPDARRRLRLMLIGTQISLTPMFLLVLAGLWRGTDPIAGASPALALPALLLLLLFPLTMAYVIVVHRALDVGVVIRQGVQYALARGGVRVLLLALSAGIIYSAVALALRPDVHRANRLTIISVGIVLILLIARLAERLKQWIDRRFFREAYNAEQILSDLSEQVRTMVETRPLLETVGRRISESLHVSRVALLTGANGAYRPEYALGYSRSPGVSFSASGATIKHLRQVNEPVRVYFDDPSSWIYRASDMEKQERAMLEMLETQLLLPLSVKDKLPGFISLGPKQSEEPYSGTDLRLLQSVATQTGLALENSQLTAAMAAEVAQRERLNRELEIAREVQERLFPQDLPSIQGLDFAGACRPALGVGGDYYDFLLLPDERLGIAIGDVSGKGIAAALLMASLQASLRGQTLHTRSDLAGLMRNVNRLVYEASSQSRYATFFYAQYEPASRCLTYVNGGHNPPMLFRKVEESYELIRLDVGGSVIGLLPNVQYQQAALKLECGDLLVAYTDGISEAMNSLEEEWGEQRLIEVARECVGLTAAEAIGRLMRAVDAFVQVASQHDDMTLVVVRVTG